MPSTTRALIVRAAGLVALVAPLASALGAPVPRATARFVTSARAYLDRGAVDGLAPGQVYRLARDGSPGSPCRIEAVATYAATCAVHGARPGDWFALTTRPVSLDGTPGVTLPPPEDPAREHALAVALAAAPMPRVDFKPRHGTSNGGTTLVTAGATAWLANGSTTTAAEVDVQLGHVPLGVGDLRLDLAASAIRWQGRSDGFRFRPETATQLYVWQAEISHRELDARTVFSFGRLWPWHVPGVAMLDGLQLGHRNARGTLEAGVYGGLLPAVLTLAPTLDEWAAGAYVALEQPGARGDVVRLAREEARVGTRSSAEIGDVREAEALAAVALGPWSTSGGGRLRYASAVDRAPVVEQAHVDVMLRPASGGGAWVQLRDAGAAPELLPLLVNETPAVRGGLHAATVAWLDLRPGLGVGVNGGWHLDRDTGRHEAEASLELQLPRLFGDVGGLWFGGAGAQGWLRSRAVYLQFVSSRLPNVQLVARASADRTWFASVDGSGLVTSDVAELGGYLHAQVRLGRRLHLRARSTVRLPIAGFGPTAQTSTALVAGLDLVARF